jgi:hypothetical protein
MYSKTVSKVRYRYMKYFPHFTWLLADQPTSSMEKSAMLQAIRTEQWRLCSVEPYVGHKLLFFGFKDDVLTFDFITCYLFR